MASGDVKYTGNVVIPESVTYDGVTYAVTSIEQRAFYECSGLTSVTIPNSVTTIGERAFAGCTGLTSVDIPNSVTSIENKTFLGCTGLTSVTIPNSVTSIGEWAFGRCENLQSVIIPSSVTSIGEQAFYFCWRMKSLVIGSSVTEIGYEAFYDCFYLSLGGNIYVEAETPPTCYISSFLSWVMEDIPYEYAIYHRATLHVVEGTKELYSATSPWMYFKNITDDLTSGIEAVSANANAKANARKFLHNGRIVIERNGKQFTPDGAEIK